MAAVEAKLGELAEKQQQVQEQLNSGAMERSRDSLLARVRLPRLSPYPRPQPQPKPQPTSPSPSPRSSPNAKQVRFLQLYRSRLGAWMRADRAAGDDVARDGGCWGGPYRAPGVTFDNGRRLVVLPALLQSEVGCRLTHPPNCTPLPASLRRELDGAHACLLTKTTYPPPPTLEHPPPPPLAPCIARRRWRGRGCAIGCSCRSSPRGL